MDTIKIRDEFIKLGQAMKLAGLVEEGAEANRYQKRKKAF